jgi:hypothetical protein
MTFTALPATDGVPGHQYSLGSDRARSGDHSINYHLNSQRYRNREFDSVAWLHSIWLFGCSVAMGIGVDTALTVAALLQQEVHGEVVNMAQGGTSIRYQVDQLHTMLAQGLRPRAVAVIWPDTQRWPWVGAASETRQQQQLFLAHTASDSYMQRRAALDIQDLRVVCELLAVPLAELTWSEATASAADVQFMDFQQNFSRDQQHPGPAYHRRCSAAITLQWNQQHDHI